MSDTKNTWSENVILIDAAFVNALCKDFRLNFSRMIGRELGKADFCHWLDCLLLDAGIERGKQTFVAIIHGKKALQMDQLEPGNFQDLHEKAFQDSVGEFVMSCYPIEELTNLAEFMEESAKAALEAKEVKHLLILGNMQNYGEELKKAVNKVHEGKEVVFFTMTPPSPSEHYKEIIVGYSLMSALGIRSEEL